MSISVTRAPWMRHTTTPRFVKCLPLGGSLGTPPSARLVWQLTPRHDHPRNHLGDIDLMVSPRHGVDVCCSSRRRSSLWTSPALRSLAFNASMEGADDGLVFLCRHSTLLVLVRATVTHRRTWHLVLRVRARCCFRVSVAGSKLVVY